ALMGLRFLWRLFNPAPALPSSMPRLERIGAHLGHFGLYLVIFLMTLTGWAMISVSDKPSILFQYTRFPLLPWLIDLPAAQKKDYLEFFEEAHELLGYALLALIAVHTAAVARHAFLLKDGVSARMMPRLRSKRVSLAAFAAVLSFLCLGVAKKASA